MEGNEFLENLTDEQIEYLYNHTGNIFSERQKRKQLKIMQNKKYSIGTCLFNFDKNDLLYQFYRIVDFDNGYYTCDIIELFLVEGEMINCFIYNSNDVYFNKFEIERHSIIQPNVFEETLEKANEYLEETKKLNNIYDELFKKHLKSKKLWKNF